MLDAQTSRRQLMLDSLGATLSALGFGMVYGLAARNVGFSPIEGMAMSLLVSAGGSQFAAVGLLASGSSWLAIVGLTALVNARHLLYSAALAPWLASRRLFERAAMAQYVTDETFALSLTHFRRLGRGDAVGFWITAAMVPGAWVVGSAAGLFAGGIIPDPRALGLDVIFPATMAGLAAALVSSRAELVAVAVGAAAGLAVGIAFGAAIGIVAGGAAGAAFAFLVPDDPPAESATEPA